MELLTRHPTSTRWLRRLLSRRRQRPRSTSFTRPALVGSETARRKKTGHRSLEAIVKIAAENGRTVRVKHTSANGETLEVEMSGEAAILIRQEALSSAAELKEDSISERLPRVQGAVPDVKRALEQLYSPTAADLSVSEAQAVIDVIVDVLQGAGLGYILPQIAIDLSDKGLFTLASALTAQLNRSHGDQEPPLSLAGGR
jgi:hypothetical protein